MDEFQIRIISTENFPPGLGAVSVFCGNVHYIIVNSNLPAELQESALAVEQNRKPF